MKARLPVICLALSALLCCGGENLLENPSFEERGGEGALLPSCWRAHKVLSLENHHQLDGAMRRTGRHSVRLVSERTEGAKHYVLWMQSDLGPKVKRYPGGTPMVLSVWTKTDHPSVRYRIYVEALKRGDENYSCFLTGSLSNPDGNWRQAVLRFTLPSDRPNYYVCLQLLSKGTVWFDDAFLGAEGEAPRAVATAGEGAADRGEASNCLSNGSMEALDKAGHPLSWQTLQLGMKGRFHWSQPTGHTGDRSLRINCQLPQLKTEHYLMWIQRGVEKRLVNCPPGTEMELSVWSNTHGNPGVKYRFYIEMQRQQKYIGSYVSDTLTNYIGWQRHAVRFTMPSQVPDSAYVCLQLLSPGIIDFDDARLIRLPASGCATPAEDGREKKPVSAMTRQEYGECRVTNFPPQHTWYSPEVPDSLRLRFILPPDARGEVTVSLQDPSGKVLKRDTYRGRHEGEFRLPKLAPGGYVIQYRAGSYVDEEYFRLAPKARQAYRLTFDSRHVAHINGKAFFPIIVTTPRMEEDAFRVYGQAGFNVICPNYITSDAAIGQTIAATASTYGLYVCSWSGLGDRCRSQGPEAFREYMNRTLEVAKSIPTFLAFMDDESEMRQLPHEVMRQAHREVFFNAPGLGFWINHAPRMQGTSGLKFGHFDHVRRFSAACDITGCDIYPVPEGNFHSELQDKGLTSVGKYTDLCRQTVDDQKPIWMILQGSGWGEMTGGSLSERQPRPSYRQLRFMVYNAVLHGSTGIAMFGGHGLRDIYTPYFAMMADVMKELKVVGDYLVQGQEIPLPSGVRLPAGIRSRAWRKSDGSMIVVMINEAKKSLSGDQPWFSQSTSWYQLPTGRQLSDRRQTLSSYDVVILSSRPHRIGATPVFRPAPSAGSIRDRSWSAHWVVHPHHYQSVDCTTTSRHQFQVMSLPKQGRIWVAADNGFRLWVNGVFLGRGASYIFARSFALTPHLKVGLNTVEIELWNDDGPSGLLYEIDLDQERLFSGDQTMFSADAGKSWMKARILGVPPCAPWGKVRIIR